MAISRQDIGLLFGVLGGGSISGESGALIKSQLDSIVASLNNKTNSQQRRIKLNLDVSGTKRSFTDSIKQITGSLSGQKQFKIKVSEIDATSAINKLRKQLDAMLRTIKVDTGFSVTLGTNGASSAVKEISADSQAAVLSLTEVEAKLKEISAINGKQTTEYRNSIKLLEANGDVEGSIQKVEALKQKYIELQTAINNVRINKTTASQEEFDQIYRLRSELQELINTEQSRATSTTADTEKNNLLKQSLDLLNRIQKAQSDWTAAENGSSSYDYRKLQEYTDRLNILISEYRDGNLSSGSFRNSLSSLNQEFAVSSSAIKAAGENTKTFGERIGGLAGKFSTWFSITRVIMSAVNAIRQMVNAVIDVDTAMTELRKVTEETEETYIKYLEKATARAKALGATLADTVNATADFARLGYSLEDASSLADAALVYKNVGDGIDAISDASESIISTMRAFGIEASEAMFIVDKFNEVGNNFAISSKGVGDALMNSASSMAAANNTLDETIALITTANSVIQDPEKVGTALKTVSMYLRAASTEAEEAGESTEGMAASVSELRDELLSLTGGAVDIQIDEDTFKSTYEILKDLSAVWNELTDITRANILELIGGKRNSNVVSALISNFEMAEDVIKTSSEASGSALKENEKVLDSIEGRISVFKATFEELATTFIGSDFVKGTVSFGTSLLNVLQVIAELVDAVGGLNTVLYVTAGIIASIKAESILSLIGKLATPIKSLISIISAINDGMVSANVSGKGLGRTLSVSFGEVTLSATAAQLAIGSIVAILGVALILWQKHKQAVEENHRNTILAADSAADLGDEIYDLTNKYLELSDAVKTDSSAKEQLLSTQDELIEKLGIEKSAVEDLIEQYGSLNNAIMKIAVSRLQDAERDLRGGLNAYEEDLLDAAKPYGISQKSINHIITSWSPDDVEINRTALDALADAGYISSGSYGSRGGEFYLPGEGEYDLTTVNGIINAHDRLGKMLDIVSDAAGSNNDVFSSLYEQYNRVTSAMEAYQDSIADLNSNLAQQYMLQSLVGKELPKDQEAFDSYREGVISAAKSSGEFIGDASDIENAIDSVLSKQAQFADFYTSSSNQMASGAPSSTSVLSDLSETLNDIQSAYSLIKTAQEEMSNGGGLSASTVKSFIDAEENYLDYLYEENGVIKLNTEAWKENANAKLQSDRAKIQEEIDSLKDQNDALRENIAYYKEQRSIGSDGGSWNNMIAAATNKIEENTQAISENQDRLAIYNSLYDSITRESLGLEGLEDALGDTTADLEKVQKVIDTINSGGFDSLTGDDFSSLLSIIPELKTELTSYYNAVQAGNDPIEEQAVLLEKLRRAATDFTKSKISDALSDAADAANEFGSDSYQAQTAMRVLSQYAPQTAAALYDEETGMYKLGVASEYTAEAILAVAKANLSSSIEEMKNKLSELETAFYATAISARTMRAAMEISDLKDAIREAMDELDTIGSVKINVGGGGGSSSTPADKIKEQFDALNSSIEHSIFLQEQYYEQGKENLDSTSMRSALIRQIAYYQQIQTEAHNAAEQLRAYYKSQGMTAAAIEAQSDIQSLSETWWSAAESIKDAANKIRDEIVSAFSDSVDEIQNVYDTLHEAADDYASSGYINIDVLQKVIDIGPQYLAFLQDENGQLVINEERIRGIIAARTQQMAVESALSYIESLRAAKMSQNIEELNNLLYATQEVTDATWGYVYASLGLLGLSDDQYQAALKNINALRALSESAINSIGNTGTSVTDTLTKMQEGLNDILEYVMDMIKQEIENQTDAIERQKDAYSDLIEMKKASLDASKEEGKYTKEVAEKVKELAKLQAKYDLLDLDDSREAQAQKAALLEEMAKLQDELAEMQADHAYDAQVDALDDMEEAYHAEKDKEIEILEDSISSYQKLYDKAISYIQDNWDTLYESLINWNTQYGDVLNSEITSAWENCLAAAQRYGNYVSALNGIQGDIDASGSGNNTVVGNTNYDSSYNNDDLIKAIVNRMKINSADWFAANDQGKEDLANENKALAAQLSQFGINAVLGNGVWYIDRVGGEKLYEKYHTGGIVGGGTLKENEQLAVLKKKEWVLSDTMVGNLLKKMEQFKKIDDFADKIFNSFGAPLRASIDKLMSNSGNAVSRVLNDNRDSRRIEISIGDTYISGANEETTRKHEQITKGWVDELARQLGVRW